MMMGDHDISVEEWKRRAFDFRQRFDSQREAMEHAHAEVELWKQRAYQAKDEAQKKDEEHGTWKNRAMNLREENDKLRASQGGGASQGQLIELQKEIDVAQNQLVLALDETSHWKEQANSQYQKLLEERDARIQFQEESSTLRKKVDKTLETSPPEDQLKDLEQAAKEGEEAKKAAEESKKAAEETKKALEILQVRYDELKALHEKALEAQALAAQRNNNPPEPHYHGAQQEGVQHPGLMRHQSGDSMRRSPAKTNPSGFIAKKSWDEHNISTWVGPVNSDGQSTYYQDRGKKYPFSTNKVGFELLSKLVIQGTRLLNLNKQKIASCGKDPWALVREGERLYHEFTNRSQTKGMTWSQEQYAHPGFCRVYIRLKSLQRFTETWALLERGRALGVFRSSREGIGRYRVKTLRIVSVGGGPGFELLAGQLFFKKHMPMTSLDLTSHDLCAAWKPYAEALGMKFCRGDVRNGDMLQLGNWKPGDVDFVIVSNLMVYVSDEETADVFEKMLKEDKVKAILASERRQNQPMVAMLERRGIKVVRLIDQTMGKDERQLCFLLPETGPTRDGTRKEVIFPNVPFEEHKARKRMSPAMKGRKSWGAPAPPDLTPMPNSLSSRSLGRGAGSGRGMRMPPAAQTDQMGWRTVGKPGRVPNGRGPPGGMGPRRGPEAMDRATRPGAKPPPVVNAKRFQRN